MNDTPTDHTGPASNGKRKSLAVRVRDRLFPGYRRRHQARRQKRRQEVFASAGWQREGALAQRQYDSYESYLAHQAEKLERIHDRRQRKEVLALEDFRRRFADCEPLRGAHCVLCLGARLGAEVQALRELGHFAVGIDLNPGRDNDYVCHGDFHDLKYADGSVDAVYTNAMDHVFDLPRVVGGYTACSGRAGCSSSTCCRASRRASSPASTKRPIGAGAAICLRPSATRHR